MKAALKVLFVFLLLNLLSGSAMAVTLDFDGATDLTAYGKTYGVEFIGDWTLYPKPGDPEIVTLNFSGANVEAGFNFSVNPVYQRDFAFDYSLVYGGAAIVEGLDVAGKRLGTFDLLVGLDNQFSVPSDWGTAFLSSINFTLKSGALLVDNINFTPTPLPGAAILFGSGLLGLVGLRRRQIV